MTTSYDALIGGEEYQMQVLARPGRCVRFVSTRTGTTLSLYRWQVEHMRHRGYMRIIMEDPASLAMHCAIANKLCKSTSTSYLY